MPIQDASALFNVHITGRQVLSFHTYERELLEWNRKFNLTAIRDSESIRTKHFLDSLSCILAWKAAPPGRLIDVGTGAGFPGIPIKILYANLRLTLVESVGKKVAFWQHIVQVLGLEHGDVIQARAEDLGHDAQYREKFDWAVARAVAHLNVLSEYLLPLVRVGGSMLAQKGESGPAEAQSAEGAMHLLGGKLRQLISVHLPGVRRGGRDDQQPRSCALDPRSRERQADWTWYPPPRPARGARASIRRTTRTG